MLSHTQRKQNTRKPGGLVLENFHQVPCKSLADSSARTSQAVVWYKGYVFVGTGRRPLITHSILRPLLSQGGHGGRPWMSRLTAKLETHSSRDQEAGTQIWRFDPRNKQWKQVYETPWVVGAGGQEHPRDRSVRAGAVFQGKSDQEAALYFGVGSMASQVVILRSIDGETFTEAEEKGLGLGNVDVPSIRTLCVLNGCLYTSPTGKNHDRGMWDDNITDFPIVYESEDPYKGHWRPVGEPAFGDPNNLSINEMVSFNDFLYAGTLNPKRGYQVWKTDATGRPPYRWHKIVEDGAYRGPASSIAVSMYVFKGALYVGSGIQRQGKGYPDAYGPFPGELIRIYSDDTWDLVVGTQRFTPHGFKKPLSGMGPGFGDIFTHAFWRMAEYNDWLYLGTSDWRFMPTYLPRGGQQRRDLSDSKLQYLIKRTREYAGGFSFWRSQDGVTWVLITATGFNRNPYNYGIRELTPSPFGLFVAPTASRGSKQGGGLEVWVGSKE